MIDSSLENPLSHTIWVKPPSGSYPIIIQPELLHTGLDTLVSFIKGKKVALITNPDLQPLYGKTITKELETKGFDVTEIAVPAGESFKTLEQVEKILHQLLEKQFERGSTVIALGGGIIGDMAGFAASILLRGVALIQVPTSLLAQVDAAIGGKTGVNTSVGKNLIGTFYQPKAVLIDPSVLSTLPVREVRCGLAEIVKYGVIQHPDLFKTLQKHAPVLSQCKPQGRPDIWTSLIQISCTCKAEVVSEDEKESDRRETLNFGHTIGHAIESAFDYTRYLHGEAVALGMIAAGRIAVALDIWNQAELTELENLLHNLGFETKLDAIEMDKLLTPLFNDKKIKNGKIRFILPTQIGKTLTTDAVTLTHCETVLKGMMAHGK